MRCYLCTHEWVQQLRNRYGRLPEHQRPITYRVAIDDDCRDIRDEIETWLGDLPPKTRAALIPRLRSLQSFLQTYHELAVCHMLPQLGHELEYEKEVSGLSADWYALPKGGTRGFVVEVMTAKRSEAEERRDRQVKDLLGRIEQIHAGAVVDVNFRHSRQLDARTNKAIAEDLRRWLKVENPCVGSRLTVRGVEIKLCLLNEKCSRVQYVSSGGHAFWVNPHVLRRKIRAKISKYKRLAVAGLPLVIGVVADPRTGFDYDDFEQAILQHTEYGVVWDMANGRPVGAVPILKRDGLCFREKELSAAMWVWRTAAGSWEFKVIHNPVALNPLPPSALC